MANIPDPGRQRTGQQLSGQDCATTQQAFPIRIGNFCRLTRREVIPSAPRSPLENTCCFQWHGNCDAFAD
jgi:hypothetical protein